MNEDKLSIFEEVVRDIILIVIILIGTVMLYTSCSATFIKGQGNSSNTTISTRADDAKIDVLDRSKRAKASNNKGGIKIGVKDTIKGATKDTIKEVSNDTIK